MSRVRVPKTAVRVAALILLVVAIAGPWVFELIVVPAEYSCSAPNIRLEGDYCGVPVSLGWSLWEAAGPGGILVSLVSGAGEYGARELAGSFLVVCLLFLPVLPFLSTLLLLVGRERRGLWVFHLTAWALAAAVSAFFLVAGWSAAAALRLWGAWLCAAVAIAALAGEIRAARRRPGRGRMTAAAGAR